MDNPEQPTLLSFCTGYGGLDIGIERAVGGVRPVAYVEIEAFAIANLVAKMEAGCLAPAPIWTDLKTFPSEEFHDRVDILTAGYPCQPFSLAGKRKGVDDPRHLWPHIHRAIAAIRPRCCFFENVEGHITSGFTDVLWNLGELGYRTTAGLFTAAECGAPHQRKRIFILGILPDADSSQLPFWRNDAGMGRFQQWPAGPGPYQHDWEPPRTVGNAASNDQRRTPDRQDGTRKQAGRSGGTMADAPNDYGRCGISREEAGTRPDGIRRRRSSGGDERSIEPELGLCINGNTNQMGEAIDATKTEISPYEVLLVLWQANEAKKIQWENRRPEDVLAQAVLQSGLQQCRFPQRICYYVWCVQAKHPIETCDLPALWLKGTARNTPQGHGYSQQLRRELAYALCILSYEDALARGETSVERTPTLHDMRKSSERAWVLQQTLPEIQKVWRSEFDEATWTTRAYWEAAQLGMSRIDELRLCGNGVVMQVAELAFVTLMKELTNEND